MKDGCILAIETSSALGSLALWDGQRLLSRQWVSVGSHSDVITLELEALLKDGDLLLTDISHILCGTGPGSFTGIRIGLNLAKTLSYSFEVPVTALNTFHSLLATQIGNSSGQVYCLAMAFRNFVYCAGYKCEQDGSFIQILKPSALTFPELNPLIGPEALILHNLKNTDELDHPSGTVLFTQPLAKNLIRLCQTSPNPLDPSKDWKQLAPLYVRASEAEEKLKSK